MKTLNELRSHTANLIDDQAIADLRKAWRFATRSDRAAKDGHTVLAIAFCLIHAYYLSRGDHRHDAANLIRPTH